MAVLRFDGRKGPTPFATNTACRHPRLGSGLTRNRGFVATRPPRRALIPWNEMTTQHDPPSVNALLADAGWVRQLALALARDPHLAEDAIQDAWVAALEGRMRHGRSPRRWFARVVANAMSSTRRRDLARERHEAAVAYKDDAQGSADPAASVARAELHQRVVAAVLDLDEPYCSTLVRRYLDDLTPDEIARRDGVPGSTVRNRLRRGLHLLRERLDAEHDGDRDAWLGLLLTPLRSPTTNPILPLGVLAMSKAVKIAAISIVAIGIAGWFWVLNTPLLESPSGQDLGSETALLLPGQEPEDELRFNDQAPDTGVPSRREVADLSEPERPALDVRVVRVGDRLPVPNVVIWACDPEREGGTYHLPTEHAAGHTDEMGFLRVEPPPQLHEMLVLESHNHLRRTVLPEDVPRGELARIDVEMPALGVLDVTIEDSAGSPQPALKFSCGPLPGHASPRGGFRRDLLAIDRAQVTDELGTCRVRNLPCGIPLYVHPEGSIYSFLASTVRIDPAVGHASIRVLRDIPGSIAGHVVTPDGKAGKATARLRWAGLDRLAVTDAEGAFIFEDVAPGSVTVELDSVECDAVSAEVFGGRRTTIDPLVLPESVLFAGRIRTHFPLKAREFAVQAVRAGKPVGPWLFPDLDGHFSTYFTPGPLLLRVVQSQISIARSPAGGWQPQVEQEIGEVVRVRTEAPNENLEIWIDEGVGILEARLPIGGTEDDPPRIELHMTSVGAQPEYLPHQSIHVMRSEWLDGRRFRSTALRAGTYAVSIVLHDGQTTYLPKVIVRADETTDLGLLAFEDHALYGVVRTDDGFPVPDALVRSTPLQRGAAPLHEIANQRGEFSFASLSPGRYWIEAHKPELGKSNRHIVATADDMTPLVLVVQPPARLTGRVLRGVEPVREHSITLGERHDPQTTILVGTQMTGDDGHFAFEALGPGWYMLGVGSDCRWIELSAGEGRDVVVRLDEEMMELRIAYEGRPLAEGSGLEICVVDPKAGEYGRTTFGRCNANGRVTAPSLQGQILVWAFPDSLEGGSLIGLGESQPGATAWIDLHDGRILVRSGAGSDAPPPTLSVLSMAGIPDAGFVPFPLALPRERTRLGGWRFSGLPAEATLRLEGLDENGKRKTMELSSPNCLDDEITW